MRFPVVFFLVFAIGLLVLVWFSRTGQPESVSPASAAGPDSPAESLHPRNQPLTAPEDANGAARVATTSPHSPTAAASSPRCRVIGRVIDDVGTSLADVTISLLPVNGRWSDVEPIGLVGPAEKQHEGLVTKSASDGRFEFEAPVPTSDWITLNIEPDAYHAIGERDFGPAGGRNKPRLVEGDNELGDFRLVRCGVVKGRVRSDVGDAIASARISVEEPGLVPHTPDALTEERGEFALEHVPPGRRHLSIAAEGWITQDDVRADVTAGGMTTLPDVTMSRAFEISGHVVDEKGAGINRVWLTGGPQPGRKSGTRSKDDGSFTLYVGENKPCVLEIRQARGFELWSADPGTTYAPGTKDVRIELKRLALFTFHVIDARTQEPIERFGLRIDSKPVRGSYSSAVESEIPLADHPGGDAQDRRGELVVVWAPGHTPLETEVVPDAGTTNVQTLALRPPSGLHGRLMLADKPLRGAKIWLRREGIDEKRSFKQEPGAMNFTLQFDVGPWAGRKQTVRSDIDGGFAFKDLAAGTYAMQIDGPGAARERFRGLEVPAEQTLQLGDVVLAAEAILRGVLVAGPGQSAEGFTIRLDPSGGRTLKIDNVDGTFEFTGLEAGTHTITWGRPTQKLWTTDDPRLQSLTLAEGEVRDLVLDASASIPCSVKVHILRNGAPAPGVLVQTVVRSTTKPGNMLWTPLGTSGEDGTVEGEVDGDTLFELEAETEAGEPIGNAGEQITATPGGSIERTIELSTGSLTVEFPASLVLPDNGWVRVRLESPDRESRIAVATTSGDGGEFQKIDWKDRRIEFGEFQSGEYDATIEFQRKDEFGGKPVALRHPYKTKVTIENGREAKIVVP